MEVLLWVAVIAVVAGAIYLSWYLKKKRREELAAVARQHGLTYHKDDPFGLVGMPFALMRKGDGRGCENVMAGTWHGMDLKEFDYWYYEESRDSEGHTSRDYSRFSCALTEVGAYCSPLTIERENLLTRIADNLGFRDIEFESEEFNRAFNIKGRDRKFANDLIDARMMKWLLAAGSKWQYEVSGQSVLCFTKRLRPAELVPLFGTAKAFVEHVPRVVYELYGAKGTG